MRASPAGRGRLPASTPVLFVIDGDPGAAHALRDDLSRRFGREFRIVCESAADAGLTALRDLHPTAAGGGYVNFLMDEGQDRVRDSYRGNYDRLARIKGRYDPDNTFRINQNIQPAR